MPQTLKDRVVLITGGGRGIGRVMALGLAAEGAAVGLVARTRAQLDKVAAEIAQAGGRACVATADVTDRAAVTGAIAAVEADIGPIDILINNAGLDEPFGPIGIIDPDTWWQTHSVHVRGPLLFMSAALPGMRARKAGRIINIASLAANHIIPNMSAYAVAKNAEIRLTQHVAAECADDGIAAFAIEPGTIITDMAKHTIESPEAQKWIPDGIAFIKSVTPEASEASKRRLVEMVTQLAGGDYDRLSGRYLEPGDDFDALLKDAETEKQD